MIAQNWFKGPPLKFPDETFGTIKIFEYFGAIPVEFQFEIFFPKFFITSKVPS